MDKHLISRIEADWDKRREQLAQRVDSALQSLSEILEVDRQQREGHRSENLQRSLGSFGGGVLDTGAMSAVFSKSDGKPKRDEARLARVKTLHRDLDVLRNDWQKLLPAPLLCDASQKSAEILGQATARMEGMARLFGQLRMAEMERRARYRPDLHEEFFAKFAPRHLDSRELGLCPPIAVQVDDDQAGRNTRIMELLSSSLPIKVLLLSGVPGGKGKLRGGDLEVELLPLGLQRVYVLQSTREHPEINSQLAKALGSPRAALISLIWLEDQAKDFSGRLARAIASREFPVLCYDPESSERFVQRFQLDGNPEPEAEWAGLELHHRESNSPMVRSAQITGGEYYAGLPGLEHHFTVLDVEGRSAHLADWFKLSPTERKLTTPFVYRVEGDTLQELKPSREVLIHCSQRAQIWETLRELCGLHNPHVEAAQAEIESRYRIESEQAIAAERQKLAENLQTEKHVAVTEAMRNLAGRLLGLQGGSLSAAAPVAAVAGTSAAAASTVDAEVEEEEEAVDSDEFWIDSSMCTACDECTTINPEIFVYNRNKQAVIKNPAGGPYKDIVKAAEKCSAKIIHPGKPLNPDEKGLDKLLERAKKFN